MNGSRTYEQAFYSTFDLVKISVSFPFFFFFLNTTHSNLTSLLFYYKEIFPEMGEITNSKYEKKKLLKFRELILFSACTTHYIRLPPPTNFKR